MTGKDNNTCNVYGCLTINDHIFGRIFTLYYNFRIDFKESNPCIFVRFYELAFSDNRKHINYEGQIEGIAMVGGFMADEVDEDVSPEDFHLLKLNAQSKEECESVCEQWIKDRQIRLKAEAINRGGLLEFI